MTSPFTTHRSIVLGQYSTASWFRRVILALWSDDNPLPSFARLQNLDDAHFAALSGMLAQYRLVGHEDPAFTALAAEVQAMVAQERTARERETLHERWRDEAADALEDLGKDPSLVDDRYNWFEAQFDAGTTPLVAAEAAEPLPSQANG